MPLRYLDFGPEPEWTHSLCFRVVAGVFCVAMFLGNAILFDEVYFLPWRSIFRLLPYWVTVIVILTMLSGSLFFACYFFGLCVYQRRLERRDRKLKSSHAEF